MSAEPLDPGTPADVVDLSDPGRPPVGPTDPGTGRELRPLTLLGHPVLHAAAAEVTVFDGELERLVEDLFASMYAARGVGLAAPQVGVGLRLFVYDCGPGALGHVCNPVVSTVPGELQDDDEGCLSVPGLYYPTVRAMRASVTGVDVHGEPITVEGEELLARCLQHETDHLSGTLYLDRLGGRTRRNALAEARAADWADDRWRPLTPVPPREGPPAATAQERAGDG